MKAARRNEAKCIAEAVRDGMKEEIKRFEQRNIRLKSEDSLKRLYLRENPEKRQWNDVDMIRANL